MPLRPLTENRPRILLTGGHAATTALAVIQEITSEINNVDLYWIGVKKAISGSKATTIEYKIYPSLGVKYFHLSAGKLQTKFTRYTIPLILQIPLGFIQAFFLLIKIRPKVILSFGGFASYPVVFWGGIFGIPVILHEQTVAAGRAAILSGAIAKKIAISHEESRKFFPAKKIILTGNPLLKEIINIKPKKFVSNKKSILITGGSRGSEFINETIKNILPDLVNKYNVTHIVGERDYEKYKDINLPRYKVLQFVDPRKMADYYNEADLVIARAGANSVAEILHIKRPAILIPLPRTFMDEQVRNAEYANTSGLVKVIIEKNADPKFILEAIDEIFINWEKIVRGASNFERQDSEAAKKIVKLVRSFI